jgi:hypothetical protein
MFNPRAVALLATPLLAVATLLILFAMRHPEEPDPSTAVPPAARDGDTGSAQLTNAQPSTLQEQLESLDSILRELEGLTGPASVTELQELTEELATTTAVIQHAAPGSLREPLAETYFQVTLASIELLDRIEVAADAGGALLSARNIAKFGRDAVTQYLVDTQLEVTREGEPAALATIDST